MDRDLRKQLPSTKAIGAGKLDFTLMGLKGFSWLFVFVTCLLMQMASDSFPLAMGSGIFAYWFIKVFIDGKPRDWLIHLVQFYTTLPRQFYHRPNRRDVRVFDKKL